MAEITVLYHDGPCLVVSKPPGLLTQAPPGIDCLELRVKAWLRQRGLGHALPGRDDQLYLGIPHRLDRPASGAIVFGLHKRATRRLAKQFERREVRKLYWAGAAGAVEPPAGLWEDTLWKVFGQPRAEVVAAEHPEGRHAALRYRVLAQDAAASWLEIELLTGRTHQVRIQAASRGHPLLGDELYGSTVAFGPPQTDERLRAIALHARQLEFRHPMTRAPVCAVAPVTADWPAL